MDFTPSLDAKGFFRFTGPPENWLTAIKFMTWGLEEKHRNKWVGIQPGDVFFIHSTGSGASLFNNAKSGIIGIGVVGPNFTEKKNYLWIKEFREKKNIWPLLVPFSELYLFSELPPLDNWDAPTEVNVFETRELIDALLKNYVPLSNIKGFPQMGSFSSVSKEASQQVLYDKRPLFVYANNQIIDNIIISKPTKLEKIKNASEALRYADTLRVFETIKTRIVKEAPGQYTRDNELLSRAEIIHSTILQNLIDIFRDKGYETLSNRFVDLFAYKEDKSFLFEVKSTENANFRSQARKGLIQLFEYDYFDISKFVKENNLNFKEKYKILVPSCVPEDSKYVEFINHLKTGVAVVEGKIMRPVGVDFGFSRI